LLRSRLFGPILTDWQFHGGVRKHVKIKAVVVVLMAVCLSVYLTHRSLPLSFTIVLLATIGIVVIVRLPTAA
jgi:uncharacterized membrane protein YbaN (DUF454 family)